MNFELILAAGIASGTILLFAAVGELFTERAGIINLGVQGMMFVGALVGFKVGFETGNPWLGLLLAMAAGAALALAPAVLVVFAEICRHLAIHSSLGPPESEKGGSNFPCPQRTSGVSRKRGTGESTSRSASEPFSLPPP